MADIQYNVTVHSNMPQALEGDEQALQLLGKSVAGVKESLMGMASVFEQIDTEMNNLSAGWMKDVTAFKDIMAIAEKLDSYTASAQDKSFENFAMLNQQMAEVNDTWDRFKASLALGDSTELQELFAGLQQQIRWLLDHEAELTRWGQVTLQISRYWQFYKLAIEDVIEAINIYRNTGTALLSETWSQARAFDAAAAKANEFADAIERLQQLQMQHPQICFTAQIGQQTTINSEDKNDNNSATGTYEQYKPEEEKGSELLKNIKEAAAINGTEKTISAIAGEGSLAKVGPAIEVYAAANLFDDFFSGVKYDDDYRLAKPKERAKMDESAAMQNVRERTTLWGKYTHGNDYLTFFDVPSATDDPKKPLLHAEEGTKDISLSTLTRIHPEILKNQPYIDEYRRVFDMFALPKMKDWARDLGFTTTEEKRGQILTYNRFIKPYLYQDPADKYYKFGSPENNKASGHNNNVTGKRTVSTAMQQYSFPHDKVTGQQFTYHIKIGEINGQKINTQITENGKEVKEAANLATSGLHTFITSQLPHMMAQATA